MAGCLGTEPLSAREQALQFGLDTRSVLDDGRDVAYATTWIGPWNLEHGWGEPESDWQALQARGITPAVHLYYWGDDLSAACLVEGCWSEIHGIHKDRAAWHVLVDQLMARLADQGPVLVLVETEFNKPDMDEVRLLDGLLAQVMWRIRDALPEAIVVLPFGSWHPERFDAYPRAIAAAHWLGVQGLRATPVHDRATYLGVADALDAGLAGLAAVSEKPLVVHDLALSSFGAIDLQRAALEEVRQALAGWKEVGVQAVLYRSWRDDPEMSTANTFGEAERHWGLADANGTSKPAGALWDAMLASQRARPA